MPIFRYTTIDAGGNEFDETIEANDEKAATALLRTQKKLIISLREESSATEGESAGYELTFLDHLSVINSGDITIFFRQLASLITSGVTLINSLHVLEEQEKKSRMKKMIGRIRMDIQGGSSFSNALNRYPKIFTPLVLGMITSGEATGMLGVMLDKIAIHLEEKAAFKNQMITSSIYPVLVMIVVAGVVIFLAGFVIPKIAPLLKLKAQKLPRSTQLIIDISNGFKAYWRQFLGCIGIGTTLIYFSYKSVSSVRYWVDRLKTKLPIAGPIFYYSVVVQFTRNMATLIGSGVSVLESLRIVKGIISNRVAKRVLDTVETHILKGENFSTPIKAASHVFPPIVASMVSVGEETGNMDTNLSIAADIHEKILQTYIKRMNTMIEPLLIIMLGCIVGFVVFAMISGILSMYTI